MNVPVYNYPIDGENIIMSYYVNRKIEAQFDVAVDRVTQALKRKGSAF